MKKLFAIMAIAALVSCGGSEESKEPAEGTSTETTSVEGASTETPTVESATVSATTSTETATPTDK